MRVIYEKNEVLTKKRGAETLDKRWAVPWKNAAKSC